MTTVEYNLDRIQSGGIGRYMNTATEEKSQKSNPIGNKKQNFPQFKSHKTNHYNQSHS